MRSFYPSTARNINQMRGSLINPAAGLNNYSPTTHIDENLMSDMLGALPHDGSAMRLFGDKAYGYITGKDRGDENGLIIASTQTDLMESGATDDGDMHCLGYAANSTDIYCFNMFHAVLGTSYYSEEPLDIPGGVSVDYKNFEDEKFSTVTFRTESSYFYCFIWRRVRRLYYMKTDYEGNPMAINHGYVDLPFYPADMVTHANRIFMLDTNNRLWWSRAGDIFSWYSMEYDNSRLLASTNMGNKTYTLTGTIDTPRVITATCTKQDGLDTLGTLEITGTNVLDSVIKSTLILAEGTVQTPEIFKTITKAEQKGWSAVGGTDKIEIGVGPTGSGFIVDDAGYWTLDAEVVAHALFSLSNVLYISAGTSIYAFRGHDYTSFILQKMLTGYGRPLKGTFGYDITTIGKNKAYFLDEQDIYEFDGDSAPTIIGRPVFGSGGIENNMLGGIKMTNANDYWALQSAKDYLYVYQRPRRYNRNVPGVETETIYAFHYESRSWWRLPSYDKESFDLRDNPPEEKYPDYLQFRLMAPISNEDPIPAFWEARDYGKGEDSWWFGSNVGNHFGSFGYNGKTPYIITKAYQSLPSETGTLTSVIIEYEGVKNEEYDMTLLYSLEVNGDNFRGIKSFTGKLFTGDRETVEIPVPVAAIANAHHYRLKLVIDKDSPYSFGPLYIYNIERRFRIRGYSR